MSSLTNQNGSDPFDGASNASGLEPAGVHPGRHFSLEDGSLSLEDVSLGDGPVESEPAVRMASRQEGSIEGARLEAPTKESPSLEACQNCGAPAEGSYCSECGQRQATGRFTLRSVLASALAEMVNLERGAVATVHLLTVAPGSLIRDYWSRRTRPFMNPIRYFLFAVAVFQVVLWQTGGARSIVRGWQDSSDDPQSIISQAEALRGFGEYFLLFFVAGVLILALFSRIGSPRNVAEELIFQLYVWGHIALLWAMLSAIGHVAPLAGPAKLFGWGVIGATVAYYTWAHVKAHRPDSGRSRWREVSEALGTLFLFASAYVLLAGAVAGFLITAFGNG